MSGHSKWATTKRRKGAVDQKRGHVFTKLANAITVAVRKGGVDSEMNFSLRLAIDRAKAANMPKENIERAIKRGSGDLAGEHLEEVAYEGFGPGKVALIIECLTPNKNRTVSEIKHILEKHGGALAGPGAVMWMFEKRGVINVAPTFRSDSKNVAPTFRSDSKNVAPTFRSDQSGLKTGVTTNLDDLELKLIDAGADDIIEEGEEEIDVYTKPENLQKVKENLEKEAPNWGIKIESAGQELVAKEKIKVTDEINEKLEKLFEELEEHQEVSEYYTNLA